MFNTQQTAVIDMSYNLMILGFMRVDLGFRLHNELLEVLNVFHNFQRTNVHSVDKDVLCSVK